MNITQHVISEAQAKSLAPDYVKFITMDMARPPADAKLHREAWLNISERCKTLEKGQAVVTYYDNKYIVARVSSIKFDANGEPVIRVTNDEHTWRVTPSFYCSAFSKTLPEDANVPLELKKYQRGETNPVKIIKHLVWLIEVQHKIDGGHITEDAKAFIEEYERQESIAEEQEQEYRRLTNAVERYPL